MCLWGAQQSPDPDLFMSQEERLSPYSSLPDGWLLREDERGNACYPETDQLHDQSIEYSKLVNSFGSWRSHNGTKLNSGK